MVHCLCEVMDTLWTICIAVTRVNNRWKYPKTEDIQTAEPEQIVKCNVKGEWDYTPDTRKRQFFVENTKDIEKSFIH